MGIGAVFVLSFITALSGALMPGPLLTVTIAQTARRGFIASVLLVLGHSLLELALVVGLAFGLGHFLRIRPVIGTVTILGGAMMLWMGYGMIRDSLRGVLEIEMSSTDGAGDKRLLQNPIIAGAAASISNPYWVLWWATIGLMFFSALGSNAFAVIGAFYLGHISGDIVWYLAMGGAISTGRRLVTPKVYRSVVGVCGGFLIFLGTSFLYLFASGKLWAINMTFHLPGK